MRNLPESRHAPKLRDSQFDRLNAVSHGKGEYAPRGALLCRRQAMIKRSTTIRTAPPPWQTAPARSASHRPHTGPVCGDAMRLLPHPEPVARGQRARPYVRHRRRRRRLLRTGRLRLRRRLRVGVRRGRLGGRRRGARRLFRGRYVTARRPRRGGQRLAIRALRRLRRRVARLPRRARLPLVAVLAGVLGALRPRFAPAVHRQTGAACRPPYRRPARQRPRAARPIVRGPAFPSSLPTLMQPVEVATAAEVTIQTARRPAADKRPVTDNWRTRGTSGGMERARPPKERDGARRRGNDCPAQLPLPHKGHARHPPNPVRTTRQRASAENPVPALAP